MKTTDASSKDAAIQTPTSTDPTAHAAPVKPSTKDKEVRQPTEADEGASTEDGK